MRTYKYRPHHYQIDKHWFTATHVYHYLLQNKSERRRLLKQIRSLEPGEPFSITITHRCLSGRRFNISTVYTDTMFVYRLEMALACEQAVTRRRFIPCTCINVPSTAPPYNHLTNFKIFNPYS